jgi:serine/threonine-protein kinase
LVGTAYYLSPEQASGNPVTPASDVYSLGVVAYECLAGVRPFPGTNPMAVATAHVREQPPPLPDDVPEPVRELVLRAMAKDPAQRPAHAGDLGRAALTLRHGDAPAKTRVLPVVPETPATAVRPPATAVRPAGTPWPQQHRRAVRIASVLLAVVVLGLSARACLAPASVVIPPVAAGTPVDTATDELTAVHLDALRVTEASKSVAAGRVIRTIPAAGETVHEGDDITLVVSSGKPKVTVSSATYKGKSPTEVRTALQGLGLVPAFAYDGSGTPAGTVSGVTPGGSLTYGAAVTVHVVPVPRPAPAPRKHGKDKK